MLVKQEIPDGDFCTEINRADCKPNEKCIFIDQSYCIGNANSFTCRRYPGVTLAAETFGDKCCIVKCRNCVRDAT